MKTIITVGQSVQVVQIGQPEKWNKIIIQKEFDGDVPEQYEIGILFEKVEMAHLEHSKSFVEQELAQKVVQKKKMDIVVLKQYEDAIKRGDEKMIADLLKVYDVIA